MGRSLSATGTEYHLRLPSPIGVNRDSRLPPKLMFNPDVPGFAPAKMYIVPDERAFSGSGQRNLRLT
jgi:hypothetical protein